MAGRIHILALAGLIWALSTAIPLVAAQGQSQPGSPDSDQPIDIDADNLEVRQNENLAIFSSNVIALQGRIQLRAEQLKVWYLPAAKGDSNKTAGPGGTIVRIDAIDKVFVSSATENAKGDMAIYEVAEQRLTLTGAVVLSRGEDVLRGNKLVMNLATGQSKISGGRVHGRFVPPKRTNSKPKR
ncbi:MAG: lipopolysaccharide transport periplasmic protein LptA [Alphaproteobacteria bacterium]|nr:lipopolysaccharide transport periplasmic protein LptA [Alphaproteobacteria bacterium]